jgi:hypothetical protein
VRTGKKRFLEKYTAGVKKLFSIAISIHVHSPPTVEDFSFINLKTSVKSIKAQIEFITNEMMPMMWPDSRMSTKPKQKYC